MMSSATPGEMSGGASSNVLKPVPAQQNNHGDGGFNAARADALQGARVEGTPKRSEEISGWAAREKRRRGRVHQMLLLICLQ